jgi:penicillin V acylase-like amidase (Ntn superfamily)
MFIKREIRANECNATCVCMMGHTPKQETDGIISSFHILNNTHRPKQVAILVKMPVTRHSQHEVRSDYFPHSYTTQSEAIIESSYQRYNNCRAPAHILLN